MSRSSPRPASRTSPARSATTRYISCRRLRRPDFEATAARDRGERAHRPRRSLPRRRRADAREVARAAARSREPHPERQRRRRARDQRQGGRPCILGASNDLPFAPTLVDAGPDERAAFVREHGFPLIVKPQARVRIARRLSRVERAPARERVRARRHGGAEVPRRSRRRFRAFSMRSSATACRCSTRSRARGTRSRS